MPEEVDISAVPGSSEASITEPAKAPDTTGMSAWDTLKTTLPEDMRADPVWDNYKETGFAGLAKDYKHLNTMLGKGGNRITRPEADAPQEDWDKFYNDLGRPETAAEYDLEGFTPPPELEWNQALQNGVVEDLHAAGLNSKQVKAVLESYGNRQKEVAEASYLTDKRVEGETMSSLQSEYGTAFDGNIELARRSFQAVAGKDLEEAAEWRIDGVKVGNHPGFIKMMVRMGQMGSEDGYAGNARPGVGGALDPVSAQARLKQMDRDPEKQAAIVNKDHHEHDMVIKEQAALFAMAYPK